MLEDEEPESDSESLEEDEEELDEDEIELLLELPEASWLSFLLLLAFDFLVNLLLYLSLWSHITKESLSFISMAF